MDTSPGEPAVIVLPLLLATIIVLDLAASRRSSAQDAKLSRLVLTGWLTPLAMVAIGATFWAAASVTRALVGWPAGGEAVIAEMGPARSWVEQLTPSSMMLWMAGATVAAFLSARCARDRVTWVQMSATVLGALLLPVW